uniref:Acetyltransferase component of pyruvate dehydrogenase complex n=1 Tax=Rhabditophanes sp. KR3021 TaxID=114890 RepID=A0AC35TNB5_9BILA
MSKIPGCSSVFKYSLSGVKVPVSAVAAASLITSRPFATTQQLTILGNVTESGLFKNSAQAKQITNKAVVNSIRQYSSELPSHQIVKLPALSPTMETGNIASWQKKEGDELLEGDLLCEIETDKATMGFETPEEGYLAKILIPEGAKDIPIGKLLCIIVPNKDDVAAFANYSADSASAAAPPKTTAAPAKAAAPATPQTVSSVPQPKQHTPQQRIFVTPFAKKIAQQTGVDLSQVSGSGPHGRILAADVASFTPSPVTSPVTEVPVFTPIPGASYTDIPLTNMRKTIAKRLTESKSSIPHYYLTSDIEIDSLVDLRKQLNNILVAQKVQVEGKQQKLSLNDFIIKATALSCKQVPEANSFFMDTYIRQNENVDVSIAVSTDSGLITPIVRDADKKGIAKISKEVAQLAAKARSGKLQPQEYQGGTFTVSNLGMFGSVSNFSAIINPPQSCILSIGSAKKQVFAGEEGQFVTKSVLQVTMSCDHRVVDGAIGAQWLKHFKSYLENPQTMLL